MSTKSILFGERAAGVYLMSEIYFPSKDTESVGPDQSGKIVPAVGSLIVDDTVGLHNQQYTVTAVDPLTYEPTLIPSTFVIDSTAQVDRVLSYGNDIFMLYFSSTTENVEGSNINLTRLIVDNKLSLFGKHAATYQLVQTDDEGDEHVISRRYIAGSNNTLIPSGTVIPMLDTGVEGIRKCDGCYTDATLLEGEEIRCDVYTAGGILIAQIRLIAKEGHLLNEKIGVANPIVDMVIKGTQMTAPGELYLYQGQNVKELGIYVDLIYSDGSARTIAIDNRRGFCYGLEKVTSSIVNVKFDILIKYYLSASDAVGSGSDVIDDGKIRYISRTATITIIQNPSDVIAKISPIPMWDALNQCWYLRFLRYRSNRLSSPYAVELTSGSPTADMTSDPEFVQTSGFNGKLFSTEQTVTMIYHEQEDNFGSSTQKEASFVIELRNRASIGEKGAVYWLIKDTVGSDKTYGDTSDGAIRPRIEYVGTTSTDASYQIPAVFKETSNQTATEVFLENFYYNANPPKIGSEVVAPAPTHFRLKLPDKKGTPLVTSLIPVEDFRKKFTVNVPTGYSANFLLNQTVVVEFVRELDATTCEYLYGVPVDVC